MDESTVREIWKNILTGNLSVTCQFPNLPNAFYCVKLTDIVALQRLTREPIEITLLEDTWHIVTQKPPYIALHLTDTSSIRAGFSSGKAFLTMETKSMEETNRYTDTKHIRQLKNQYTAQLIVECRKLEEAAHSS